MVTFLRRTGKVKWLEQVKPVLARLVGQKRCKAIWRLACDSPSSRPRTPPGTPLPLDPPPTQRQRERAKLRAGRGREISGPPARPTFRGRTPLPAHPHTIWPNQVWPNAVAAFVLRVHGDGVSSVSGFFHCAVVLHLFACNFFTLVVRCATDAASVFVQFNSFARLLKKCIAPVPRTLCLPGPVLVNTG